ncbi:pitrilysin family protein [Fructilactobacillus vespulae]|uniref:EF-P 5-aminopentanol modification-associated protein YfmH n=1 Tax=Fructilactobacillus vespulae TaxID=1249630 RepID=UPI0039B6B063
MNKKFYPEFNETVVRTTLSNGLQVILNPKSNFNSTYGILTTDYGSINNYVISENKIKQVPAGIAHFIEHKMFDKEKYDISDLFAENSADNNAFTSFSKTSYLFSTTTNLSKNLDNLVELVMEPFFSTEKIQKEQGIIGQEILMYQDDPSSRLYFDTIANLYCDSPLSQDIAGSIKSISEITTDDLYESHRQYYFPQNLSLVLVGNFSENEIVAELENKFAKYSFGNPSQFEKLQEHAVAEIENSTVVEKTTTDMGLTTPKVAIGYRGLPVKTKGRLFSKAELSFGIFLEMIFSEDSEIYQSLYEKGIINDSFGFDFDIEEGYLFLILAEDTKNPDQFVESIEIEINHIFADPSLIESQFELIKNEEIGDHFTSMDSISGIANQMGDRLNDFTNIYDEVEIIRELEFNDVIDFSRKFFKKSKKTINQIN